MGEPNQTINENESKVLIDYKVRKIDSVPYPAPDPLSLENLMGADGKPHLDILKDHLFREGRLTEQALMALIQTGREVFRKEDNILSVPEPVTVAGDIHGQFYDLMKLLEVGGTPGQVNYLFLGDYVDRGMFSCECVFYMVALKINYPDKHFMIRGNHECRHLTEYFNFKEEMLHKYNIDCYNEVMNLFDCLPLAAIVNEQFLCIHGGISPEIQTLEDIMAIDRFQEPPPFGPMCDLLWADPLEDYNTRLDIDFDSNEVRGCSYFYGYNAVCNFLDNNNLLSIIRAHEAQDAGYRMYKTHEQTGFPSLITLFSAPNYLDSYNNKGAVMKYENNVMNIRQFNNVEHPYWLPHFMNVFSWSIPFVAEKLMDMFSVILNMAEPEAESTATSMTDLDDKSQRREIMRQKIKAVGRLALMFKTLRLEHENVVKLKNLLPDNKLPVGLLQGGSEAIEEALSKFELSKLQDRENEKIPEAYDKAFEERRKSFSPRGDIPPARSPSLKELV